MEKIKSERCIVVLYMLFVFLSNFTTILYFLTFYLSQVGFSVATVSLGILVYQVCRLILEVPSGLISDRFGHRFVGLLGLSFMALYYILLLNEQNFVLLVATFISKGIGVACLSGSFEAIYIAHVNEKKLVQYNSIENAIFYVSYGITALLGGIFAQATLFNIGITVDLIAVVLSFGVGLAFPVNDALSVKPCGNNQAMQAEIAIATNKTSHDSFANRDISFMGLLQHIKVNHILCCLLLMDFAQAVFFVGFEDFYSVVLKQNGLGANLAGISLVVQLIVSALIGLFVPHIVTFMSERKLLAGGYVGRLLCMSLFFMPFVAPIVLPIVYIFESVFSCFCAPIKRMIFQRNLAEGYRAAVLSAQSQSVALGAICFSGLNALLSSLIGLQGVLILTLVLGFGVIYGGCIWYLEKQVPKDILN